jgi:threonine/homoserine/homoserine lactone efflux protein
VSIGEPTQLNYVFVNLYRYCNGFKFKVHPMNWQEFTALLMLATAMSFTPGPNTTLSTALAANGGLRRAMRFVVAVPVGWSLLLVLCAAGVGTLVVAVPSLRWSIKALGIGYLLWLAWKLSRSGSLGQAHSDKLNVGFRQGVLLQFVNIKAWLLALTLVAGWVVGQPDAVRRFAVVAPVMLFYAFTSNFTYAMVGSLLRRWLAQGRRLLWFNRAMAAVLVLTAWWMLKV